MYKLSPKGAKPPGAIMDYNKIFEDRIEQLHKEGRYRVFADIRRRCGAYPQADHFSRGVQSAESDIRPVTVWCSNDYLGMSQNPLVRAAMHEAIDQVGAGSGGTRNISGTTHYHVELEAELADLHGKEAALLFTSAYIANDATVSTIVKLMPGTVIFSDEKNHASMIQGIRHGGGEKRIWRHNDTEHLEELLAQYPRQTPKIIVFESVYSMDGHIAPIGHICDLAEKYGRSSFCWRSSIGMGRWHRGWRCCARCGATRRWCSPARWTRTSRSCAASWKTTPAIRATSSPSTRRATDSSASARSAPAHCSR
jgi:5-aminolevulinate synthase